MDIKLKDNSKLKLALITQLEYIESTGTQYIDTGIKADNNNQTFKIGVSFLSNSQYFGSGENGRVQATANIFRNTNTALAVNWGGWSSSGSVLQSNYPLETLAEIEIKAGNVVKLNGNNTAITAQNVSFSSGKTANFILNGFSDASNGSITGYVVRTHYFIVENNGIEIIHLIPVKDKYDVVCLYDTVSETFFYNQGTGDFIAGPKVPTIITSFPNNILLKTTTLYHKNTPNVDGLQLINTIFNYQKTHQDEVKEYYYPATQLWRDIITEYPNILYWYNLNHKFCVYICEADDPEQYVEDFLNTVDNIQQELEDYPDLIPIIAENPSLAPIIAENPEVVHSLIDTRYETVLTSSGTQYIDSGVIPTNNFGFETSFKMNSYNGDIFGEYSSGYSSIGYVCLEFLSNFKGFVKSTSANNSVNPNVTLGVKQNVSYFQGVFVAADGTSTNYSPTINTQQKSLYVFCRNAPNGTDNPISANIYYLKLYDGTSLVSWLVPIQNNGNPCMIDLLTGTKYLNQGTGSFTYSIEPKNA